MKIESILKSTKLPRLEAEILLAHLLQKTRSFLIAHNEEELDESDYQKLELRRLAGEPIAYITGKKEFWSLELNVNRDTLIPRPETELIVELVLAKLPAEKPIKLADLGTGSGAIAIAIAKERPAWQVIATDKSEGALAIASKNAQRFGLENISFLQGNWCTALPFLDFDVIVSNPPYIALTEWDECQPDLKFEPEGALLAGEDGLMSIREILTSVRNYLKPEGIFVCEHGYLQGMAVRKAFHMAGFTTIETVQDASKHERITLGQND